MATFKSHFPWTESPLIVNAPMAGFAGGNLASTVTLAGGLGLIGSAFEVSALRKELEIASSKLSSASVRHDLDVLPVGVGVLPFILKLEDVLPLFEEFKPAVIWLFASKSLDDYAEWAKAVRKVSPKSKIWVQIGSVEAALHVARTAQPDTLCMQGADAGGHGFEKGAGIISLVPEAVDALAAEGFGHILLVAAGGIVDGRDVAAALSLGAHGVVMGTRFLGSQEVNIHPNYQAAVLEARDGGQVTTRSKLFDQLRGPNPWPELYDGRSLVIQSHKDYVNGMDIQEIQKLHNEAVGADDKGYQTKLQGRAAVWAGTGVGLVGDIQSARYIVEQARVKAKEILEKSARS